MGGHEVRHREEGHSGGCRIHPGRLRSQRQSVHASDARLVMTCGARASPYGTYSNRDHPQGVEQYGDTCEKTTHSCGHLCVSIFRNSGYDGKTVESTLRAVPTTKRINALCAGFIWGSIETARALKVACEPAGVSGARLTDMTIKYLLAHPQELDHSASSLIIDMYKKEFPCPPSRG